MSIIVSEGLDAMFTVLAEPTIASQPREGPLDDPGQASDFKGAFTALDDVQPPALLLCQGAGEFLALMPGIGNDGGDRREHCLQSTGQQSAGAPTRDVGGFDPATVLSA